MQVETILKENTVKLRVIKEGIVNCMFSLRECNKNYQ